MNSRKAKQLGALTGLVAASALAAGMSAGAATASTPNSPTTGHAYRHGVVPTVDAAKQARKLSPTATSSKTLRYGGGIDGIGVTSG